MCLAVLVGCGRCGFQPDPGVKIVVPVMPSTLDWNTSDPSSWVNYPVMLATMRGLTSLGADNSVQPGLAASWDREVTAEGHDVYTFHLRKDVRWSDGETPLTAHDFVYGWRRAVVGLERGEMKDVRGAAAILEALEKGATREEVAPLLEHFEVRALDDHTLRVELESPRSYFLSRMANVYLFFPAPSKALAGKSEEEIRDYFDRPKDGHPLTLGPWTIDSWDRAGERVRLRRNPHSAFSPEQDGKKQPEVVTLLRSEIGSALYERGRAGFVFIDNAVALQQERPADLERRELLSTYFIGFNTQKPPLDRPEVRRAIAMALERDALLEGLLPAARPTRTLLPRNLPGAATLEEEARLPQYAPEQAKVVLTTEVDRPLRLLYRAGESFLPEVAIAERIKTQLAKVGVTVEVQAHNQYAAELARRGPDGLRTWDLYLRRLGADYAHPNTFFTLFKKSGNSQTGWESCDGGTSIRRFEELLQRADADPDPSSARALYAEAQAILLREEAVIVPIYHPDRYFRMAPGLGGLDVDPFNFLSIRDLVQRDVAPGNASKEATAR